MVPECRKAVAILSNIPPSKRFREGLLSGALPTGMQSAQKHTDPPKGRNFDRGRLPPPSVRAARATQEYPTGMIAVISYADLVSIIYTPENQVALVYHGRASRAC